MKRAAVLFTILAACARIAAPPGGPPDKVAPILIATVPDSEAILPEFNEAAEFQFNEVVSEGGQPNFGLGTGDLEKLIVLSPSNQVPHIGWHHSRITVKPREGWQPNRVYRVELLAGVRDLRSNTAKSSAVITFTTGAPLPTDSLLGIAVDWGTQRTARGALIEAVLQPDSLVYRTTADSTGRFHFSPLPAGEYLVYSVLDANHNNRREEREAFDSVRVKAGQALAGELWMFKHDTLGPRIQAASTNDSLTATISFVGPLDPYQRLTADSAVVRILPDSTQVKVVFVLPQQIFDSLQKAQREDSVKRAAPDSARRRDSARAQPRDTARRTPTDSGPRIVGVPRQVTGARRPVAQDTLANQPLKTKPPLFDKLMVRVAERWRDSTRYVIELHGLRTVSGTAGVARTLLTIPVRPPPPKVDSTKIKADTAAAKADSLRPARDTTRRDTTAVTVRRSGRPSFRP